MLFIHNYYVLISIGCNQYLCMLFLEPNKRIKAFGYNIIQFDLSGDE